MRVKLIEDGIAKFGSISALHRALASVGSQVALTTLTRALSRSNDSLKWDVIEDLVTLIYEGNWNKAGAAISQEAARIRKERKGERDAQSTAKTTHKKR